jgi:hypothetical protein
MLSKDMNNNESNINTNILTAIEWLYKIMPKCVISAFNAIIYKIYYISISIINIIYIIIKKHITTCSVNTYESFTTALILNILFVIPIYASVNNYATISLLSPTNIGSTKATFNFKVTYDGDPVGNAPWQARCVWSAPGYSNWHWTSWIYGSGDGGTYHIDVTGLLPNKKIYFKGEIYNSMGFSYPGGFVEFWTLAKIDLPTVLTWPAKNITCTNAQLELFLVNDGNPNSAFEATTGFTYWKSGGPQISTGWEGVTEGQKSTLNLSRLDPNTIYYFYAKAKNYEGEVAGDTLSFKTYPDPNSQPVTFEPNEPNTLLIQNFVKTFQIDYYKPHDNQGLINYVEGIGLDGIDANDVLYTVPASTKASKIVSLIVHNNLNLQGQIAEFYELSKDARTKNPDPNNPNNLILLEASIYSVQCNPDSNTTSENGLKFWLAPNAFKGKSVTIQKVSTDPNIEYPVWDVNEIITKNGRKMPFGNLVNQKPNVPYAHLTLSTNRQIADIDSDGDIDLTDYALLLANLGKSGVFRSDIACTKGLGLPDGVVNMYDESSFIVRYNKSHTSNPIPNPYELKEGFENGEIKAPFTTSGDALWTVMSDYAYTGNFSARSGVIGDYQGSVLEVSYYCAMGKISFKKKVSSEGCDYLTFFIDGVFKVEWSGEQDWSEVSYNTTPGTHTFMWIYSKDGSSAYGEDAAWLDDIDIQ